MTRAETMWIERWRIQAYRDGLAIREMLFTDETKARKAFDDLTKANEAAAADGWVGYDNLELQVRRAGAARYRPVLQDVGGKRIDW